MIFYVCPEFTGRIRLRRSCTDDQVEVFNSFEPIGFGILPEVKVLVIN